MRGEKRMKLNKLILLVISISFFAMNISRSNAQDQTVTNLEDFFGFQMGADRKLANWHKLVEYYQLVEKQSPRIKVVNMGDTAMGNPFLALYISSPENLANMDQIKAYNDQLTGSPYGFPKYEAQISFPNPWKGGWWRVRDIVEQQKIAALSLLDISAKNRETVLQNSYLKASRQTERGANGETKAYIIPANQHDALTMAKMINVLLGQGIEVKKATAEFTHEGHIYAAGSYVVSMEQPKQGLVRWLLGRTFYPDNSYTRLPDGSPKAPYDMSTDNVAEYMGVDVKPVRTVVTAGMQNITEKQIHINGTVENNELGYVIDGKQNDSFRAVNLLWNANVKTKRIDHDESELHAGDFIIPASVSPDLLANIAKIT
jgi:hypothetical protein